MREKIIAFLTRNTGQTEQPKEKVIGTLGGAFLELFGKGLSDTKSVSDKLIKANEGWVYANVTAIAKAVSTIEFELFKTKFVKNEIVFDPVRSHLLLDLLDRFNDFTTTSNAMHITSAHLDLTGDEFYLLDKPVNPTTMFILQPDKVELEIGDATNNYMVTSYFYKDTIDGKYTEVRYDPEQVIHIKVPNPNNPYRGKSTVEAAAQTIDIDTMAGEMTKNFFKNAAVPNFLLSTEQKVTKDDLARLEAEIRRNYQGYTKAFKTMILGGGLEPKTLSMSNREMQFVELQGWTRDKIMALFGNTKTSLGITDDVNRANAESSIISWMQNVVKPRMQLIADSLNEFLVPKFGTGLILGFKDPVPENRDEKLNEVKAVYADVKRAVVTTNEARELLGYDEVPGEQYDTVHDVSVAAGTIPQAIKNVSYKKFLRREGTYEQKELLTEAYAAIRPVAEKLVKNKKKEDKKPEVRESLFFTNDEVWSFWEKQIRVAEGKEIQLQDTVSKFLLDLEDTVIENLPTEVSKAIRTKQLFDEDEVVNNGIDLFTPLLTEIAQLSGEEAYALLELEKVYLISQALKDKVKDNVEEFVKSMIETDKEKLGVILGEAIDQGESIPQIERRVRTEFEDIRKTQSERIARTESLRASNQATLDAFKESDVVEAKQWLTAMDDRVDPICADLNGKIIKLNRNFFSADFGSGLTPPIHPNCRCVLLPVLKDVKAVQIDKLKSELTKRDKKIQKVEKEKQELQDYTEKLEKVALDEG